MPINSNKRLMDHIFHREAGPSHHYTSTLIQIFKRYMYSFSFLIETKTFHLNKFESCCVLSFVESGLVVLEKKIFKRENVFSLLNLPLPPLWNLNSFYPKNFFVLHLVEIGKLVVEKNIFTYFQCNSNL